MKRRNRTRGDEPMGMYSGGGGIRMTGQSGERDRGKGWD